MADRAIAEDPWSGASWVSPLTEMRKSWKRLGVGAREPVTARNTLKAQPQQCAALDKRSALQGIRIPQSARQWAGLGIVLPSFRRDYYAQIQAAVVLEQLGSVCLRQQKSQDISVFYNKKKKSISKSGIQGAKGPILDRPKGSPGQRECYPRSCPSPPCGVWARRWGTSRRSRITMQRGLESLPRAENRPVGSNGVDLNDVYPISEKWSGYKGEFLPR